MIRDRTVSLCGESIDRPGHICAFFESRDQEYDTLIPYFLEGLAAGEEVINIVDQLRYTDHVDRLTAGGVRVAPEAVNVRTSEETYLESGQFDIERMCDFIRQRLVDAQAAGKRVRTSGAMNWLSYGMPGSERAIEYEARMNLLVPAFDCTFMCVYDLKELSGEMIVDILATHPYAIVNGKVRANPFFVTPEIYLDQMLKRRRANPT